MRGNKGYIGIIEEKVETTIMGYRAKALDTGSALDHGDRAACSGLLTVLVPIKPKWVPNCADDASVRGARAPRTETSSAQLGPHFGPFSVKLKRNL